MCSSRRPLPSALAPEFEAEAAAPVVDGPVELTSADALPVDPDAIASGLVAHFPARLDSSPRDPVG
jgi:hypothetical protein